MKSARRTRCTRLGALAACLAWLGLAGCGYRYQFDTGAAPSGERVEARYDIFVWGWFSDTAVDLERACPKGVARFGSQVGFQDWLFGFVSLGLYTPRTTFVDCAVEGSSPRRGVPL